jgi:site-specific DNA recombinase
MRSRHDSPLVPRNGHTLVVGIVARISGCQNQKELSLEDQEDHARQVVAEYYQGAVDYRVIATKGKGERLDRPELEQIEAMLRTRELDLLVAEDIGRMIRGAHAMKLCGIAVDHGTRVLAPNDFIDTADDNWEEEVMDACRQHVGHNAHTSKRLKHKLMNRFTKFGGATAREVYGYVKPPGSKTYDEWQKDPAAAPIYDEWKRQLMETRNCSAVADWLNQQGVPTGKYARRKSWNGAMVRRITANTLLKGMPRRGLKHTVKHHETGRRVSVKNPEGPSFYECPHLAFWTPEEFDELNALLDSSNQSFRHKRVNDADPRLHVPRKRTRFPGQHALCWYCGREYVWGGNGVTENLMCRGAREWRCWNSIGFPGALAAQRVAAAITQELIQLQGFDAQFRALVEQAHREGSGGLRQRWEQLMREETATSQQEKNLQDAIAAYGPKPILLEKLTELEALHRSQAQQRRALERMGSRRLQLPESLVQLHQLLEEKFATLALDSPEFGNLVRQLVPGFHVYLVRLCDGGHLLSRARLHMNLDGLAPDTRYVSGMQALLRRELTLDLFERPPQRERIRVEAVRLAAKGLDQRTIVSHLPVKVTVTAVQHALAMDRRMHELGFATPYLVMQEPPSDYPKLRRHRNPKYRFESLTDYQRPTI